MYLTVMRFTLLAGCSVLWEESSPAQTAQPQAVSVLSVSKLTTEMRRQMLTKEVRMSDHPFSFGPAVFPVFHFRSTIEEHGLTKSRCALRPLLTDPDTEIREQAAKAAGEWMTCDAIDDEILGTMLRDQSFNVRGTALKFVPESGLSPELAFAYVRRPRSMLHLDAVELLPAFVRNGNEEAKQLLLEKIESWNPETAAAAMQAVGSLGIQGRFAESALPAAVTDEREHYVSTSIDTGFFQANSVAAAGALRQICFKDDSTAEALRKRCEADKARYLQIAANENTDEYMDDKTWLAAAIALAKCRHDFEPVRTAIEIRAAHEEQSVSPDPLTISLLLEEAPAAIIDWELGEEVCRRLLCNTGSRSYGGNWEAIQAYPNAREVFAPEIDLFLAEVENSTASALSVQEVITLLASDGLSESDLQRSLEVVGKQNPDNVTGYFGSGQILSEIVRKQFQQQLMLLVMSDLVDEHPDYAASFKVLLKELYPDGEPALRTRVQAKLDGIQVVD